MKQTQKSAQFLLVALMLFIFLFVFFLYTFLHEAGHAITGLIFGQSLTEFDVSFWDLSAHVGMTGGNLTPVQLALQAVAGVSLPLLAWGIFISLVPRDASFILAALKLLCSITVINTLIPWIVIPILVLFGKAPSDDVTNFLRYSEMPPLLLTLTALLVYVSGCLFLLSKTAGLRNQFLLFRDVDRETMLAGMRKPILVMSGVMVFVPWLPSC